MKYIYLFNEYKKNDLQDLLGNKGANLSKITNLGLPVSNGFIITTDACNQYYRDDEKINPEIQKQINEYINKLEQITGKNFGNINNPLLVSIKCGAKNEIPNIMNTILNVGLTEDIVENLSKNTNDFIWIWECYLNFIQNYSKNVIGIDLECFKDIKNILKNNKPQLTIEILRMLASKLKEEYKLKVQTDFPDNSTKQLTSIINFSFKSWSNERANVFRNDLDIPFTSGLAICIQSMVFGNINKNCGTGTIFTRDPITGEKKLIGNFSKQSLETYVDLHMDSTLERSTLSSEFSEIYGQLKDICKLLESHYKDMLKIDFVIENNKLFVIQVSKGKRTANAALKIACDFFDETITNNLVEKSFGLTKTKNR